MPTRMCRICRKRADQDSLTRWAQADSGWIEDPKKRISGRGVYTCSPECSDKLTKGRN
jgi:predicted RNA-binding protein YlxR (DUF448 family)